MGVQKASPNQVNLNVICPILAATASLAIVGWLHMLGQQISVGVLPKIPKTRLWHLGTENEENSDERPILNLSPNISQQHAILLHAKQHICSCSKQFMQGRNHDWTMYQVYIRGSTNPLENAPDHNKVSQKVFFQAKTY